MLFDLDQDPDEHVDLAKGDCHAKTIVRLYGHLHAWGLRMSQRVTRSDDDLENMRGRSLRKGILPFLKDGTEVPAEWTEKFRGPVDRVTSDNP